MLSLISDTSTGVRVITLSPLPDNPPLVSPYQRVAGDRPKPVQTTITKAVITQFDLSERLQNVITRPQNYAQSEQVHRQWISAKSN